MHIIGDVEGQQLFDRGRFDRYGRNAGEGRGGAAGAGRRAACRPVRRTRCFPGPAVERIEKSQIAGSGGDQFDSAARTKPQVRPHQDRFRWRRCWRGPSSRSTKDGSVSTLFRLRLRNGKMSCRDEKRYHITAEPRESRGKNEARRLRVQGFAPAVVYGAGQRPGGGCHQSQGSQPHPATAAGPQHHFQR